MRLERLKSAQKEIRIQYSGLVVFSAKLASIVTGMIFTLLVTRNSSEHQFGVWANISDLTAYFILLASALPFWTTRFVARGKEGSAKTGIAANLIIGLICTAVYLPLAPLLIVALSVDSSYVVLYLIAAAQILSLYMINAMEACLRTTNPQATGYGLLVEELFKIAIAYILFEILNQALLGAMIGLIIGVSAQTIYYLKLLWPELKQQIQWNYVRQWLKGSTVNIMNLVANQFAAFVFILLFFLGGGEARGYYQAAWTFASIITYSSFLSFALYPKLLAKNSLEDVTASLKMVLMFAIPMMAGIMAMPSSFLIVLDEPYATAAPVLFVLAIDAFIMTLSGFYTFVLFGVEKLDQESSIPFRKLIRSHIFKVFLLPFFHAAITVPATIFILSNFALGQPLEASFTVAVLNTEARLAMFLVLYALVHRTIRLTVPWLSIAKYFFSSSAMALVMFLLPHPTKLSMTFATALAGMATYAGVLLAIDNEARDLTRAVFRELRHIIGRD